jgi:hypothetical protein
MGDSKNHKIEEIIDDIIKVRDNIFIYYRRVKFVYN